MSETKQQENRVSLCFIVKNEELNLREVLPLMRPLFGEIVIVDTGSSDESIALARAFGARVVQQGVQRDGIFSFSKARNAAIHECTMDWVCFMDADERIDIGQLGEVL